MALEDLTGTKYLDDLNSSNPAAGDNVSEGDDHIRGIKNVLKTTFPNIDAAVNATPTELNYVDGVTSAIQTQMDAKLPLAGGTMTGNLVFGDNVRAQFGAANDLELWHDGNNSIIKDNGTGNLRLRGTSLALEDSGGNRFILCDDQGVAGAVTLYHLGDANPKLATTSTGVDVTGVITADGLAAQKATSSEFVETASIRTSIDANPAYANLQFHSGAGVLTEITGKQMSSQAHGSVVISTRNGDAASLVNRAQIAYNGDISFYEDTGTTAKFHWDASAESLGIGTISSGGKLEIYEAGATAYGGEAIRLTDANVAHGMTGWYPTTVYGALTNSLPDKGGLEIVGFSDDASTSGLKLDGFIGVADPTDTTAAIYINGAKKSGTGQQAMGASETVLQIGSAATKMVTVLGSGNVSIGTTASNGKLNIQGSGSYNSSGWGISSDLTIRSSEMTDDAYHSILQLVSIRQSLGTGASANGFLGFSTIDDSNNTGINDALRIASVNENGTSNTSAVGMSFWTNAGGSAGNAPTEKMRIDSSGNVGIGTTSPTYTLDVYKSAVGNVARFNSSSGNRSLNITSADNGSYLGAIWKRDINSAGGTHIWSNNGSERMRIDSSGNVGIGTSSPSAELHVDTGGVESKIKVGGAVNWQVYTHTSVERAALGTTTNHDMRFTTNNTDRMTMLAGGNVGIGTTSPDEKLEVNGSIKIGNFKIENSNGGRIGFNRNTADGAIYDSSYYAFQINGAYSGADFLDFQSYNGSGTYQGGMRLTGNGYAKHSDNGTYDTYSGADDSHQFNSSNSGHDTLWCNTTYSSFDKSVLRLATDRTASGSFRFMALTSGNLSDDEFKFNGNGTAYADGTWEGGGADYAEYFEWSDGNASNEDRRGISVVLDDDKIRPAVEGESPIGVISRNPSVVGDTDIGRWKQKYLRSDFGDHIWETYTITEWEVTEGNEEGEEITRTKWFETDKIPADVVVPDDAVVKTEEDDGTLLTRKKLNPDWVEGQEYISREDRPEWDKVGLMGKVRVLKGQQVDSRWIKMRDVSDTVEEWLIR